MFGTPAAPLAVTTTTAPPAGARCESEAPTVVEPPAATVSGLTVSEASWTGGTPCSSQVSPSRWSAAFGSASETETPPKTIAQLRPLSNAIAIADR